MREKERKPAVGEREKIRRALREESEIRYDLSWAGSSADDTS